MTDKADIVICFYRAFRLWPYVAYGLKQNQDYIGTVIISADEEWGEHDKAAIRIAAAEVGLTAPIKYVGHPRQGMQQAKCINTGIRASTTEFVLTIDDDIVLAPACIKTFLKSAESGILLTGRLHDVARHSMTMTQIVSGPVILREDRRLILSDDPQLWLHVRDSFLFFNVADYWSVGGHDESYQEGQIDGYGFLDYDFGMNWCMKFGPESYEMTFAKGYHMSGLKPGHQYSLINQSKFKKKEQEYYRWLVNRENVNAQI